MTQRITSSTVNAKKLVCIIVILLLTSFLQAEAQVSVEIVSGQAACGSQLQVQIRVSGASNMDAFGMTLTYNTANVSYVSTQGGSATSDWAAVSGNETTPGQVVIGGFKGVGTAVDGSGELALVTFQCASCTVTTMTTLNLTNLTDDIAGAPVTPGTATCNHDPGPLLSVTPVVLDHPYTGGSAPFTVTNEGGGSMVWSVDEQPCDWVTVTVQSPGSPLSSEQSAQVTVLCDENTGPVRVCDIVVDAPLAGLAKASVTVTLTQGEDVDPLPILFVFPATQTVPATSVEADFTVKNNGGGVLRWDADEDCTWVSFEPVSGSLTGGESEIISGTYQANSESTSRTCALTFTALNVQDSPFIVTLTQSAPGGKSSGGGCFIATAAYGTPMAEEVNTLRSVRDTYMLNNGVGTAFVDSYYRLSPPIADFIAQSSILRAIVRTILTPIVLLSKIALVSPLLAAITGLAMTILLVRTLRVFLRRRRAQIA